MQGVIMELRFAMRMLWKSPLLTLVILLTLALGIGANTAIFSLVQSTLLDPLPFPKQERLIVAWKSDATANHPFVEISIPETREWRSQSEVFEHLAAMTTTVYGFSYMLTGRAEPVKIQSARVSSDFFSALGVPPGLGRSFTAEEDRPGSPRTIVLSHRLWREQFNADPKLIGQAITLNDGGAQASLDALVRPQTAQESIPLRDLDFTVVGVMPPAFDYPAGVDVWVPLSTTSGKDLAQSRIGFLQVIGRLKPAVSHDRAQAELDAIVRRIAAGHPEMKAEGERAVIKPLADHMIGDARPALFLLQAATALLLLIACANIANLLLARSSSRRKEMALRAALGARRGVIVRQLMGESALLCLAGGGLGVLFAYWLIDALVKLAPADIPRIETAGINLPVLVFSVGVTLVAALLCGLAPALAASKVNLNETLNAGSARLGGDARGRGLRDALVVAQIGVTLVLLIGAGLVSRSFLNLRGANLGFDPRNILSFQLQLHGDRYPDVEKTREFSRRLIERLEAQPGVLAAGAALIRPMEGPIGVYVRYATEGQSKDDVMRNPILNCETITPNYLRSIGLLLKAGRDFGPQDTAQSPPVALIGESMARKQFGSGVDPIGRRIHLGGQGWRTIVGVVGDARLRELKDDHWNVFIPYTQDAGQVSYFAVRTVGDPLSFLSILRREAAALDPEQAPVSVMTMDQRVSTWLAQPRFNALLLNLLSGLAAMLAIVGVYAVISYSVAERTREIGVRMALGAQRRQALNLILGQGIKLTLAGVALGLVGAFALTRVMTGLLYGVNAIDPLTFAATAILLSIVGLAACFLPALRATRINPMIALRGE
jgi:predicted permease